jgi:hypothetical protein
MKRVTRALEKTKPDVLGVLRVRWGKGGTESADYNLKGKGDTLPRSR